MVAKRRLSRVSYQDGILDFNIGFIGTAILAIVFLALGALVQYGSGEVVEQAGVKYIAQLIKMYAFAIGDWSKLLIALIAFMCMFGTTITVIDGYSRANNEALRILLGRKESSVASLNIWMTAAAAIGIIIILFFMSDVIFGWLNFSLVLKGEHRVKGGLFWLAVVGLTYLTGFTLLFIAYELGWI